MLIFKEKGGSEGKRRGRNDVPPKTFFPQTFKMSRKCELCHLILSEKEELIEHIKSNHGDVIKKEFAKEVISLAQQHKNYLEWLSQINDLAKETHECVKVCTEEHFKETTVTKNLPSGENIFETTTTKYALQKDGTTKKIVVKAQVANITTRKRESDGDSSEVKRKVGEAERRQAKNITNIFEHVSGNDEDAQASLMAKVIDHKNRTNPGFARQLARRSKALQEKDKYSPEQTAALISGAKVGDNVFAKLRTASNKTFGHNPFASRHKVAAARENILPMSR